jgi:hypothetical protein
MCPSSCSKTADNITITLPAAVLPDRTIAAAMTHTAGDIFIFISVTSLINLADKLGFSGSRSERAVSLLESFCVAFFKKRPLIQRA